MVSDRIVPAQAGSHVYVRGLTCSWRQREAPTCWRGDGTEMSASARPQTRKIPACAERTGIVSRLVGGRAVRRAGYAAPPYLMLRAASIYGGTNEIQKNILNKAILRL